MSDLDDLVVLVLRAAAAGESTLPLEELRRLPGFAKAQARAQVQAVALSDVARLVAQGLSERSACASVARRRSIPLGTLRRWVGGSAE